jgi:FtsP/CotA-like multicopper oxidase with cupredoxin domain
MKYFIFATLMLLFSQITFAKVVHYDLKIENRPVNLAGKEVPFAIMVNGSIPAPTLEFTEGDDAEIVLTNGLLQGDVSIHWHGILLPPEQDGVPFVSTPPIMPGQSYTYKFKIRQHGTYWYHSHSMQQEQKGVFGAIVIHPQKETIKVDHDVVVMLNDWSNENPDQIIKNLKKDGDYYLYKKNTVRSIMGAAEKHELGNYFQGEWDRMGSMDLSDVGYDAFLLNGKKDSQIAMAHPGETVRLRIINGSASTYFNVSLADLPMQVITADGREIEPIQAKKIFISTAETYDVIFKIPQHKNFQFKAQAQDGTGFASGWIGVGEKVFTNEKISEPEMDMSHMNHADMEGMEHMHHESQPESQMIETLTVDSIKSVSSTELPRGNKTLDLKLVLGGDMNRYVWYINGKTITDDRYIYVDAGDVVRINFINETMMHHPMHLHGHFFRVLNENKEFSPLKHTVDVPPMSNRVIEFYANEPGQWMLHCHNLYHMNSGMARVLKYNNYQLSPEMQQMQDMDHHAHDHWYETGAINLTTNAVEGSYKLSQTWNEFDIRAESKKDEDWKGESDVFYRRWLSQYLNLIAGVSSVDHDYRGEAGVGYTLPLLIQTNLLSDHHGKLRIDLGKKLQWTSTIYSDVDYTWREDAKLGNEFSLSLMYARSWAWAVGLRYTGSSIGAGLNYRF